MYLSIVSPVYKAEKIIPALVQRIESAVSKFTDSFEIILVNDGSPDKSWDIIAELANEKKFIKAINLSRNFGQHNAINAGLEAAKGKWIVVMDCDLQDQPEEIEEMLVKAESGFDIVLARRVERSDSFFKKLGSKLFYKILGYLTGSEQDSAVANFGVYNKKVIKSVLKLNESTRYFPALIGWVGFRKTTHNVRHGNRHSGQSSYNLRILIRLAIPIILAYSDKPLKFTIGIGLTISLTSLLMTIYTIYRWFEGGIQVIGYASLISSIWFMSGIIILTLGIVGLYVNRIFEDVKNRPKYLIKEVIND